MNDVDGRQIETQITIIGTYDDCIKLEIYDVHAGVKFLEMELTREQFINVVLNRLANTPVEKTVVRELDKVGKYKIYKEITFEILKWRDEQSACEIAERICPEGYIPKLYFSSQESFFEEDGKYYAKTRCMKWVDEKVDRD